MFVILSECDVFRNRAVICTFNYFTFSLHVQVYCTSIDRNNCSYRLKGSFLCAVGIPELGMDVGFDFDACLFELFDCTESTESECSVWITFVLVFGDTVRWPGEYITF